MISIDLEKAYDGVSRKQIMEVMRRMNVGEKWIKNISYETKTQIINRNNRSNKRS